MANIYNKAGLVAIPAPYKDGFLYNIRPDDDILAFRFDRGSSATFVNKEGFVDTSVSTQNTPRIDYTDSLTSPALLLEPSSSNIITRSETFNTWNVNGNASTSLVQQLNPSGQSGCLLLSGATDINWGGSNNAFQRGVDNININSSYTFSVFVKSLGSTTFTTTLRNNNTGTLDRTVHDIDGNWKRVSVTASTNSTQSLIGIVLGGTNGDVLLWGAQLEEKSFATSYIPTYGAAATRLAETCVGAGSVSTFNSTEGVLYAEIAALANSGTFREISLNDGATNNAIEIRYNNNNNQIQFIVRDGGSVQVNETYSSVNVLDFNKAAISYKANDFKIFVNGTKVFTDTSGTIPSGLNELSFNWGNTNPFYGRTKGVYVFNEALSDDELQQLTGPEYNTFAALAAASNYTIQ